MLKPETQDDIFSQLEVYELKATPQKCVATVEGDCVIAEVQAVLTIVVKYSTIVQTEQYFMAGLAHYIRESLLNELRADTLSVLDLDNITESPKLPRIDLPVTEFTFDVSQTGTAGSRAPLLWLFH